MKHKDIYGDIPEQIAAEVEKLAVARARYRVQEDYNTELIQKIAVKTGHENLAAACFVDVDLDSTDSLEVHAYHDWTMIDGLYHSNSSFHQSGDTWTSIEDHYSMSKEEFWEKKEEGYGGGAYGAVDSEWIMDNFWDGVYWITNGWPRGNAEFLHSYRIRTKVAAGDIIEAYHNKYVSSNRFQKYIQEEINKMKK